MADIVSELASKCNISPELAQKGLGTILTFMKSKLPPDTYAKVSAAVPGADNLVTAAKSAPQSSGGMVDAVTSAVGKMSGGGGATEAVAQLAKLGFSAEQLETFVPKVLEFLKTKLPPDVVKQISGLIPVPEPAGA